MIVYLCLLAIVALFCFVAYDLDRVLKRVREAMRPDKERGA